MKKIATVTSIGMPPASKPATAENIIMTATAKKAPQQPPIVGSTAGGGAYCEALRSAALNISISFTALLSNFPFAFSPSSTKQSRDYFVALLQNGGENLPESR